MITLVDYGVGNLYSLQSSFAAIGEDVRVTGDPETVSGSERIILPGVGAFGDAAGKLRRQGLDQALKEAAAAGTPLLGICLGMQLLFEKSLEYGEHAGLGLIRGTVRPIGEVIPAGYKIPHTGWNALHFERRDDPLFRDTPEGEWVYFVHSYHAADCADACIATAEYGYPLTAAAGSGNVWGCQFHPEKSGKAGLRILKRFCRL